MGIPGHQKLNKLPKSFIVHGGSGKADEDKEKGVICQPGFLHEFHVNSIFVI